MSRLRTPLASALFRRDTGSTSSHGDSGFTLIEVLAITLVVGIGMLSLLAVVLYGLSLQHAAQAACTAIPTAISAAHDPSPLLPPETQGDWTTATIDPRSTSAGDAVSSGWLNGYWVVREEHSETEDLLGAWSPGGAGWSVVPGGARSVRVTVRVYENGVNSAKEVAFFTTRIIRQAAP